MTQTASNHNGNDNLLSSKLESSALWKLKTRLQFSGWLQFAPNAMLVLVFLLLAGIGRLIGVVPLFFVWLPLSISALLFANLIFDISTLKLGLRPSEAIPTPKTELDAFDLMRSRRSCRSFQPRNLTDAHREALFESVRLHCQPEHLLGTSPIRLEYIAAPLTVWPVLGAHEFFVAIAPKAYDRLAVVDVGRSLQKVVLQAMRMGVATCWIGPGADHKSILAQLGEHFDPETEHIICVCAIGYESWFKPFTIRLMQRFQHKRLPLSSLFFADPSFREPLQIEAPPFSNYGRCYEVCQWSPSSFNSQTTRCAAVMEEIDGVQQLVRFDFAAATTSRYYAPVALGIWCANWETGCKALGLPGSFVILSPEERKLPNAPEVPVYSVSWIVEHSFGC